MTAANALTASKAPAMAVDGAAPPIQEQEREGIVAMVVLADAITEICTRDHPPMAADLAETLTAWQERNQRYVGYAQADPRYAELRKKLVTQKIKKPDGRMPQSQCDEALRRLRTPDEDVDALRMRHAKKP